MERSVSSEKLPVSIKEKESPRESPQQRKQKKSVGIRGGTSSIPLLVHCKYDLVQSVIWCGALRG